MQPGCETTYVASFDNSGALRCDRSCDCRSSW